VKQVQRLAVDELHHEVRQVPRRGCRVATHAEVEEPDGVLAAEPGERQRLALEAVAHDLLREARAEQHLHGHRAIQRELEPAVHRAEPAGAHDRGQRVFAVEHLPEEGVLIAVRGLRGRDQVEIVRRTAQPPVRRLGRIGAAFRALGLGRGTHRFGISQQLRAK
jgi:hypothetical protein